mgnify:CR=1 FL=1
MSAARISQEEVERYLQERRRHGFQLQGQDSTLRSFVRFAQEQGATHLTLDLARNWAQHTASARPLTWARRIEVLRGFARYLVKIDPETVVPPRSLFGPAHRRLVPHIFTKTELTQLLQAAGTLLPKHGLRAATCRTLFGLLAATGLRIGEALCLERDDVDLTAEVLHIRKAKGNRSRWVPVHNTTAEQLRHYAQQRDQVVFSPITRAFFLRADGHAPRQAAVLYTLQAICRQLGWRPRGQHPHHRLHDLRHTCIVHNIIRFYEEGRSIDQAIAGLSIYVGHAKVTDTYWYVTGIPELMAIAANRFHAFGREGGA